MAKTQKQLAITIAMITMLLVIPASLQRVIATEDKGSDTLKIKVHLGNFPQGDFSVSAGTDSGEEKQKFSNGKDVVTFEFDNVDVGEGIWGSVTVDGEEFIDYGYNHEAKEPENLYPQYTFDDEVNNNNDVDGEQRTEQTAQCNIYGDDGECNIDQRSGQSIGGQIRDFVGDLLE